MGYQVPSNGLCWDKAAGLGALPMQETPCLQGALVPDLTQERDQVAVIYDKGQRPPQITVHELAGSVHKVCADGVAVAVVARAKGPALLAKDVLLVERSV